MSKHVWLVREPSPRTVGRALDAVITALKGGLDFVDSLRFTGYAMETIRQETRRRTVEEVWTSATSGKNKSKHHRYARGINRENYLLAGRMLLEQNHVALGMIEGTPAEALFDILLEREGM